MVKTIWQEREGEMESESRKLLRMLMSMNNRESESGTAKEMLSVVMKKQKVGGIVALKGRPSTGKTEVAHRLGRWAMCPVLCIQDFLGDGAGFTCNFKVAEADFSPPTTPDRVECHHRRAFASLLAAAVRLITYGGFNCVVIKSSLSTPFELHQLLQLCCDADGFRVIIIECTVRNKYLWKLRFETLFSVANMKESRSWSRPRSWKDIEKVMEDDDDHPPSWDLNHPHLLLQGMKDAAIAAAASDDDDPPTTPYVAWLRADPFYDLFLAQDDVKTDPLPDEFNDAIKYLLTAPKQELPAENPYLAEYGELRRFLFGQKLSAAALKGKSQSFCEGDCVFRFWQQVPQDYEADFCEMCQREISRKPAYKCHFCVTTLHKTCAERFPIEALQSTINHYHWCFYVQRSVQDPCKDCKRGGKEFSKECRSCLLQHRLKCHRYPTIFNHNSHQHFLSILLHTTEIRCIACGEISTYGLGCKRCAFYCGLDCAFLPLEVKHEQGGHEHILKLMYTRDGMEDEEVPCWCDYCYRDMDPETWFYSCQECPHYVVHLLCSDGYDLHLDDPKMLKFVDQLQSQVDDLFATGNSVKPC